jgi:hypothetical protein
MESKAESTASKGGKLKLSCSVRIKPCGSSEPGIDNYDDSSLQVGTAKLGAFTSIIGPEEGQTSAF